ncbi:unnamed protein product [Peronospora belbahrii]|uniref:RING-type domain-containing protein n=1 Tax=Peronospora belbahrii TaxID=622444 RepID=A0AAU9KUX9_9STRA|nr:unnamed protein product [Peronospora belbahrii]CAH0520862.1 unnamed protein product [Peronospora belbahrii]
MRYLINDITDSFTLSEETQPTNENLDRDEADRAQEQDIQHLSDNKEENTAEFNDYDGLFASGNCTIEDESWESVAETVYNVHLQLAPSISCSICLRMTQFPARQDCGHVLCLTCMQHSLSFLGNCTLCQAQQIFRSGKTGAVSGPETMGYAFTSAGQDLHLPLSSSAMFPTPYQGAIVQLDHMHFNNTNYSNSISTAVSTIYDVDKIHHDLLPASSLTDLQLDNLSDFDDVIDLDDLVSSDSERPSPPVAARTSLSGSFIAGPARHPRTSVRKIGTYAFELASATKKTVSDMAPTVGRATVSQAGKRKARTRKGKREEIAIVHMVWKAVKSEGLPPDPRYDCGLAIHKSVVIVVGGIVGKLRLNDLHTLDLAERPSPRWVQPPISGTPPPPGHLLQIFVIKDDLYAIGGTIDGKFLTELHRLDFDEWKWERLEVAGTLPSMRYWYSLVVLQGMAILYGGYGHPQRLSDTFALRFDTEIPTWVELQPRGDIPGQSSTHSVCVIEDHMYIFGGYDGKYRRGQLFAFTIEDASNAYIDCVWHKVETQGHGPASRYTHSATSIGSTLIVYGGNTGCLKGDAYILDLGADDEIPIWKLVKCDPPLIPRAWHRALTWNGGMYVFGGNTTNGQDNSVMRLTFTAL